MKSKVTLVLTELLIMILVFSLAAAVCLQVFVRAGEISRHTALRDEASILAQNAAELLKATGGDLEQAAALCDGALRLELEKLPADIPGLGEAQIRVYSGEELLVSFQTGWQEVAQ